jgi:hypothetical protein
MGCYCGLLDLWHLRSQGHVGYQRALSSCLLLALGS